MLLVASALASTVQSAKAAVFTLSCDGVVNLGAREEPVIKMEVIVNLDARTIGGFSGIVAPMRINENWVIFKGDINDGWHIEGSLDRITGNLRATKTLVDAKTNQLSLLVSYDLICTLSNDIHPQ
jgi:hypothetical protein